MAGTAYKKDLVRVAERVFGPASVKKLTLRKPKGVRSWTACLQWDDREFVARGGSAEIAVIALRIMIEKEGVK